MIRCLLLDTLKSVQVTGRERGFRGRGRGPADRMQEGLKEERRESRKIRGLWVCMSEVDGDDIIR